MKHVIHFLRDESGPTAFEYAVMLAMILVVVLGGITLIGQATQDSYGATTTAMEAAINR